LADSAAEVNVNVRQHQGQELRSGENFHKKCSTERKIQTLPRFCHILLSAQNVTSLSGSLTDFPQSIINGGYRDNFGRFCCARAERNGKFVLPTEELRNRNMFRISVHFSLDDCRMGWNQISNQRQNLYLMSADDQNARLDNCLSGGRDGRRWWHWWRIVTKELVVVWNRSCLTTRKLQRLVSSKTQWITLHKNS